MSFDLSNKKGLTRRKVLVGGAATMSVLAAPAYLRKATAATPIKIGIPTVITGVMLFLDPT